MPSLIFVLPLRNINIERLTFINLNFIFAFGLTLQKSKNYALFYYNYQAMNQLEESGDEYIDEYKLIKPLGSGYQAIVYLAVGGEGNLVAIKKFKKLPSVTNSIQEELQAMEQLHHQNLIRLISIRQNAIFKDRQNFTSHCFALVLQYAGGGQLFDFIADTGKFTEKVTRTYFHQMMNGIHYMHERGYAHRDIKPENLLLSDTFVLKIADFGFCCLLKGRDGTGILKTKLGTQGYMAPEIFFKEYDGRKTDIFAAGVILFIMYTGTPPFEKAINTDNYYKLIREKKFAIFWQSHSKKKPYGYFSEGFKDLFQKMIASDPAERLTIYEIAKHPWVKSAICTHSEIKKEFTERKQRLQKVLEERSKKCEEEQQNLSQSLSNEGSSYRGDNANQQFVYNYCKLKLAKHIWPQMEGENRNNIIVRNHDTEFVICMLKEYLSKIELDLQLKTAEEEDLIEAECDSFTMKAEQLIIEDKTLKSTFIYVTPLKKIEVPHRIIIRFHLGKNKKGNSIIEIQPEQNHYYCRLIQRNIAIYFS